MANIKSAKKRIAVNNKKQLENRMLKSQMQTALKKFYAAINKNDAELAEKLLPETMSIVDGMAAKGIIHANNAQGKVAKLSKTLSDLKSGKLVITVEPEKVKKSQKAAPVQEPVETVAAEVTEKPKKTRKKAEEKA